MITKERLEELIKQGATIWCSYKLNYTVIEVNLTDKDRFLIYRDDMSILDRDTEYTYQLKNLFETKKQAKWCLDNTFERTEKLALPMWEEFYNHDKTIDNYRILFTSKDKERIELCICGNIDEADPESIVIFNLDNDLDQSYLFDKLANEENYKEACKLCGKLFAGEE